MQYNLYKLTKVYVTDCAENILDTILLIGSPIFDKNTQVFYTWPKHVTEISLGFSIV